MKIQYGHFGPVDQGPDWTRSIITLAFAPKNPPSLLIGLLILEVSQPLGTHISAVASPSGDRPSSHFIWVGRFVPSRVVLDIYGTSFFFFIEEKGQTPRIQHSTARAVYSIWVRQRVPWACTLIWTSFVLVAKAPMSHQRREAEHFRNAGNIEFVRGSFIVHLLYRQQRDGAPIGLNETPKPVRTFSVLAEDVPLNTY